ncbi:hypothetical protein D3C87_1422700 [compost metagenome]
MAHAVKVQRVQAVYDHLHTQVAAECADVLTVFEYAVDDGNDLLAGGHIDVGFGQYRAACLLGALVPIPDAGVETLWHPGVRTDDKDAIGAAHKDAHEGRGQRLLFEQFGNVARVRIQSYVL